MKNKNHTINDVYKIAGKELTDKFLSTIKEEGFVEWFYTPNKRFENKSPYDLCVEGKKSVLEKVAYELEEGFL